MKGPTRYVLLGGAGILMLGLAVGVVAYIQGGLPALARAQSAPDELRYLPAEASVVAFADVRDVMMSDLRKRLRDAGSDPDGQREFRDWTGIDIENDIDRVAACLVAGPDGPEGLVVASGRFNSGRLEALVLEQGGSVEDYRGIRLVTRPTGDRDLSVAFIAPEVLALGSTPTVRRVIDLPAGGDVTSNQRLMALMSFIPAGSNAWVIARLDDPASLAWIPDGVRSQIPSLVAFALGGRVNGGVSGTITVEARDEQAGQNLRDVVQGFLALVGMQGGRQPGLRAVLDGFQLTSMGRHVTLNFDLPLEVLDRVFPAPTDDTR